MKYLPLIENMAIRKTFSQYRVSNHKLQIERGRYENTRREQRICKLCHSGDVENELHFALTYQKYEYVRNDSNNILKRIFFLNTSLEGKQKLCEHAMSSDDPISLNLLSIYFFALPKGKIVSSPSKFRNNE